MELPSIEVIREAMRSPRSKSIAAGMISFLQRLRHTDGYDKPFSVRTIGELLNSDTLLSKAEFAVALQTVVTTGFVEFSNVKGDLHALFIGPSDFNTVEDLAAWSEDNGNTVLTKNLAVLETLNESRSL